MFLRLGCLIVFLLVLAGCTGLPVAVRETPGHRSGPSREIFIASHGWHTGIILPADLVNGDLPQLERRFGTPAYYEFGWGDKGFYQSKKITFGLALRAIFTPTDTVMHVVAVPRHPARYFHKSRVIPIRLSDTQLVGLRRFLTSSFRRTDTGDIISLKNGLYGDSQFYQAVGRYYLFNTCNVWTAKGLKSAGMDINPGEKLTAGSVMDYLANTEHKGQAFVSGGGNDMPKEVMIDSASPK